MATKNGAKNGAKKWQQIKWRQKMATKMATKNGGKKWRQKSKLCDGDSNE
jgi:hypothetical protein